MRPTPVGSDPPGRPADSDAALIGASRRRPQAFAAIFDRHADELYRYVAGRVAAPGAVEGFEDPAIDQLTAQQLHPRLARALGRLPAEDRDLLLLVAWGDLTYQQAGHLLGIPVGTVASRLHRVRRRLRRALGDADPAGGAEHG